MLLSELKAEAKTRKIKGFSTMKKAELVAALEANDRIASGIDNSAKGNVKSLGDFTQYAGDSFIDGLKATFANEREVRSNKGRYAGSQGKRTRKTLPEDKEYAFRLQRGSDSATLTPKQAKRVRKTEAKLYNLRRGTIECFGNARRFTYA